MAILLNLVKYAPTQAKYIYPHMHTHICAYILNHLTVALTKYLVSDCRLLNLLSSTGKRMKPESHRSARHFGNVMMRIRTVASSGFV